MLPDLQQGALEQGAVQQSVAAICKPQVGRWEFFMRGELQDAEYEHMSAAKRSVLNQSSGSSVHSVWDVWLAEHTIVSTHLCSHSEISGEKYGLKQTFTAWIQPNSPQQRRRRVCWRNDFIILLNCCQYKSGHIYFNRFNSKFGIM